jgi:hypothetical protein
VTIVSQLLLAFAGSLFGALSGALGGVEALGLNLRFGRGDGVAGLIQNGAGPAEVGGTHAVLHLALQDMVIDGHRLQLIDAHSSEQARHLLDQHPETALVLLETPSNPMLEMVDLRAVADLAHAAGAIVVVDTSSGREKENAPRLSASARSVVSFL